MIAIQFSNVSLVLGARRIFENLSWEIQHDQKIGLIGPNGAGKSAFEAALEGDYRVAQAQSELEAVEASLGEAAVYANPHSLERTLHAQQRCWRSTRLWAATLILSACASRCWVWACPKAI